MVTAALFDFDGVLLDSEQPTKEIWRQLLPHSQDQLWEQCLGVTQHCEQQIFQHTLQWSADCYFQFLQKVTQHLPSTFSLRQDAIPLLKNLRGNGCDVAIVTSRKLSELPQLMDTYEWLELIGNIDLLVTGDIGLPSKPHPAPYLYAINQLGVPAECCVAIEDSPNGIESATNAGIDVVALEDTVQHNPNCYKKPILVLKPPFINGINKFFQQNSYVKQCMRRFIQ